jgi:hypothetical protein
MYEVSDMGRVRSWWRWGQRSRADEPRLLSLRVSANRYSIVRLTNAMGQRTECLVHRLVLEAFVGPPPDEDIQGHHRDGRRTNNRLSNLEWLTPSENARHPERTEATT